MKPIQVLLVEDNEADVVLTREHLDASDLPVSLHVVRDGEAAVRFLQRRGEFAQEVRPDLVLLDLNLPRLGGDDVLRHVKADRDLRSIPVVVLTSSDAEQDVARSYARGANSFVTKPVDLDRFDEVVGKIGDFWLGVARLPTPGGGAPS
jgi:CheY-like chemotaxis protein